MSELKPCPCCNGISWVYYRAFTTHVYCDKCGLRTKDYGTEAEAIEAWNTRHERTCHVEGSCYDELMDESYTDLSCGHHLRGAAWEFDFCPVCGARVKEDTDAD